jgi:hemerythrin
MAIVWRAEMSIDGGVIDDDHKCLIGLVNDVDLIASGPTMQLELSLVLAKLDAYARHHFEREERLQIATGFTFAQAHNKRHRSLMRELDTMRAKPAENWGSRRMDEFRLDLSDFLYHWLSDHILKVDRLMKPFVSEMRQLSRGSVPLAKAVELSQDRPAVQVLPSRTLPLPFSVR